MEKDKNEVRRELEENLETRISQLNNVLQRPLDTGDYSNLSAKELDEITWLEDEIDSIEDEIDLLEEDDDIVKDFFGMK